MDDRRRVTEVEFMVDAQGKVWLNVDGECVFRAGFTTAVRIDIPDSKTGPVIDHTGYAMFVFDTRFDKGDGDSYDKRDEGESANVD